MLLTGGSGTGKTTTTSGIIRAFQAAGLDVLLAAPTGRAAKRMTETSGIEAKTIHRLLEYQPPEGYKINEKNPLSGDVLIVDECSMIDVVLMYNLLKAVPDGMAVVLVGDVDQLPSVGAGNVLRNMIESQVLPMTKLERVFRQAQGSKIITNAHRINQGLFPEIRTRRGEDFYFIREENPEAAAELIVDLCGRRLPEAYGYKTMEEIQVLTLVQRGAVGVTAMNEKLQRALNPMSSNGSRLFMQHGGVKYYLHDKVMQIRNDYDKPASKKSSPASRKISTHRRERMVRQKGHQ